MSYCRWSSDNWKCDLYCYEDANGYITHVADNRIVKIVKAADEANVKVFLKDNLRPLIGQYFGYAQRQEFPE